MRASYMRASEASGKNNRRAKGEQQNEPPRFSGRVLSPGTLAAITSITCEAWYARSTSAGGDTYPDPVGMEGTPVGDGRTGAVISGPRRVFWKCHRYLTPRSG